VVNLGLLSYDVYEGYRLAQAYGYFLPEAVPVAEPAATENGAKEQECWAQYEADVEVCRCLKSRSCYDQAMQRYAACLRGGPMPPFPY